MHSSFKKFNFQKLNLIFNLENYSVFNLEIDSEVLSNNPLKDNSVRKNITLVPNKPYDTLIFYLSGLFNNGTRSINTNFDKDNLLQEFDKYTNSKPNNRAAVIFVDAWTSLGGSQFINSKGCGNYEDYIVKEILPAAISSLNFTPKNIGFMGGSSGGYGGLKLLSSNPQLFNFSIAFAPDSDFNTSLLPDLKKSYSFIESNGGLKACMNALKNNELRAPSKIIHTIMNALCMHACYSHLDSWENHDYPVTRDGEVIQEHWNIWLKNDPINFLNQNINFQKGSKIILDVGVYDQFLLQFGTRKIFKILKNNKSLSTVYNDFEGDHFDFSKRRPIVLDLLFEL